MPDISALGELKEIQPLDLENYKEVQKSKFTFPRKGEYTLQAPEKFVYTRTGNGDLLVDVSSTVLGPTNEGLKVRFQFVSAKPFANQPEISQVGMYLRAFGIKQKFTNEQDLIAAIESTANRAYTAVLDREAKHFASGFKLRGEDKFPKDENGEPQSWVEHPTEKNADGSALRLRANVVVAKYLPAA